VKLKFKKRESLHKRINDFFSEKNRNYERRMREKADAMTLWHEKFAWYPMRLDSDSEKNEWAWFEKVTQRINTGIQSSEWRPGKVIKKFGSYRYTSKDFFKLRLAGKISDEYMPKKEEKRLGSNHKVTDYVKMEHDGTDFLIIEDGTTTKKISMQGYLEEYVLNEERSDTGG